MWTGFKINYDKNAILKFKRLRYDFGSCDNYNGQVVEIRTGALSQVSGVSGPSHRDRSTDPWPKALSSKPLSSSSRCS